MLIQFHVEFWETQFQENRGKLSCCKQTGQPFTCESQIQTEFFLFGIRQDSQNGEEQQKILLTRNLE